MIQMGCAGDNLCGEVDCASFMKRDVRMLLVILKCVSLAVLFIVTLISMIVSGGTNLTTNCCREFLFS